MSKGMLGLIRLSDALALVDDLFVKLAGEDGPAWLAELKRFLSKKPTWAAASTALVTPSPVSVVLPRWRTVQLGEHKTAEAYVAALEAKGVEIGKYARQMLAKMDISTAEYELELFLGSARDLGFTRKTSRQKIFERAAQHGYYPCPAEVGPAAFCQHEDRPRWKSRVVAMEPIATIGGSLEVFDLCRDDDGTPTLCARYGDINREYYQDYVWIWCRCKPQT